MLPICYSYTYPFSFYRAFVAGCKDMNTRVHAADFFSNLVIVSLGAQRDVIINAFFEQQSLDVSFALKSMHIM